MLHLIFLASFSLFILPHTQLLICSSLAVVHSHGKALGFCSFPEYCEPNCKEILLRYIHLCVSSSPILYEFIKALHFALCAFFFMCPGERSLFVVNSELKIVEKSIGNAKALGKCLVLNGLRDGGA